MHPPSLFATRTPFAPSRPVMEVRSDVSCPRLPASIRYALIRRPERTLEKPVAYKTLQDLVVAVHRDRREAPIELRDIALLLQGEDEPRPSVSIWILSPDGDRMRFLGWAYLGGGRRNEFEAALFAALPRAWAA